VNNCARLAKAAGVFEIPLIATKQANFGAIVKQVKAEHKNSSVFEKKKFSMWIPEVEIKLRAMPNINTVVLYGIETQVCIYQTAMDLLEAKYRVVLVVDAISSMEHFDRNVAIEALRDAGCQLITFQGLVFEYMRSFEYPKFKQVLQIVKGIPADSLDLHHFNSYGKPKL